MAEWSARDLPDLSGRTIVVTGANSGLGYETALGLARRRARVVMACRDPERAAEAAARIRAAFPGAALEVEALDLASLASVRGFAKAFLDRHASLHALVNNAGVMAIPRLRTVDGFEMQLGVNHLGHFALTGLLLPRLLGTPGARVVSVSSTAHRIGRIHFEDLHLERRYARWPAYAQSKLANLLFAYELQRWLESRVRDAQSLVAHPGYAATNLQVAGPRMEGARARESLMRGATRLLGQSAAGGALPILFAAAAPEARGGEYFGPSRFFEMWGPPRRVRSSRLSHDRETASRLWEESERLTGVRYSELGG